MTKLLLENSAPFQGLPEIVADEEGLFAEEGLEIEWVERDQDSQHDSEGLNPFLSHGKMLERGEADLYNACEWGNYCRDFYVRHNRSFVRAAPEPCLADFLPI